MNFSGKMRYSLFYRIRAKTSRPTKLYCDPYVCGRNFRSLKSMNKKNRAAKECKLKRAEKAP